MRMDLIVVLREYRSEREWFEGSLAIRPELLVTNIKSNQIKSFICNQTKPSLYNYTVAKYTVSRIWPQGKALKGSLIPLSRATYVQVKQKDATAEKCLLGMTVCSFDY